jgi:hypothetical protein
MTNNLDHMTEEGQTECYSLQLTWKDNTAMNNRPLKTQTSFLVVYKMPQHV